MFSGSCCAELHRSAAPHLTSLSASAEGSATVLICCQSADRATAGVTHTVRHTKCDLCVHWTQHASAYRTVNTVGHVTRTLQKLQVAGAVRAEGRGCSVRADSAIWSAHWQLQFTFTIDNRICPFTFFFCIINPCFTTFCFPHSNFNAPYQSTPLRNLRFRVFGLTPCVLMH